MHLLEAAKYFAGCEEEKITPKTKHDYFNGILTVSTATTTTHAAMLRLNANQRSKQNQDRGKKGGRHSLGRRKRYSKAQNANSTLRQRINRTSAQPSALCEVCLAVLLKGSGITSVCRSTNEWRSPTSGNLTSNRRHSDTIRRAHFCHCLDKLHFL